MKWTSAHLDHQLAQIRSGADGRTSDLEINALVQFTAVTDASAPVIAAVCDEVTGLTTHDATETPYLMIGSVDEIVTRLLRCRDRWGITYFAVRELDAFAPVIAALRSS